MKWSEQYNRDKKPSFEEITEYVHNPMWQSLCTYIETTYAVAPSIEYSGCGMAPGWNVKYKRSGKSICTLYPKQDFFTCLVVIGAKDSLEAETVLTGCDENIQTLYHTTKPFNGGRWLMVDVVTPKMEADIKELLFIRTKPPKKKFVAG